MTTEDTAAKVQHAAIPAAEARARESWPLATFYIVTTPPGPDCQFVEVETADGKGVRVGEWEKHPSPFQGADFWRLGPFIEAKTAERQRAVIAELVAAGELAERELPTRAEMLDEAALNEGRASSAGVAGERMRAALARAREAMNEKERPQ